MKSPFPGMDPYLVNYWGDVRSSLLVYGSGQLNQCLPEDLVARMNFREIPGALSGEFPTERFIEIQVPKLEYRLVTLIRFIDPRKRSALDEIQAFWMEHFRRETGGLNIVELDLVCDRQVVIRRAASWNHVETILLSIREPVPIISIPLRKKDAAAHLSLQPLLERAYVNGGHESLNYQGDADPPLKGEEAEWADTLLRAAGKRK